MTALLAFVIGVAVGAGFLLLALAVAYAAGEPRGPRAERGRGPRCGHDIDCSDVRNV